MAVFNKYSLTLMTKNGTLIVGNAWHKVSHHAIFTHAFQVDLDQTIASWDVHM
jgi:hypothetical protein